MYRKYFSDSVIKVIPAFQLHPYVLFYRRGVQGCQSALSSYISGIGFYPVEGREHCLDTCSGHGDSHGQTKQSVQLWHIHPDMYISTMLDPRHHPHGVSGSFKKCWHGSGGWSILTNLNLKNSPIANIVEVTSTSAADSEGSGQIKLMSQHLGAEIWLDKTTTTTTKIQHSFICTGSSRADRKSQQ